MHYSFRRLHAGHIRLAASGPRLYRARFIYTPSATLRLPGLRAHVSSRRPGDAIRLLEPRLKRRLGCAHDDRGAGQGIRPALPSGRRRGRLFEMPRSVLDTSAASPPRGRARSRAVVSPSVPLYAILFAHSHAPCSPTTRLLESKRIYYILCLRADARRLYLDTALSLFLGLPRSAAGPPDDGDDILATIRRLAARYRFHQLLAI